MKKLLVACIAAAAFCGVPALAADMPVKAPPPAPVVAPTYSWTGFYIGGNAGGVIEHASGTSDFLDPTATGTAGHSLTNPQNNSFSNTRFIGGLQAGYNWQFDPRWVVGVEADWDWTNTGYNTCRATNAFNALFGFPPCSDHGDGFENFSSTTNWIATARARLGVTVANFLLYGTGGAAVGRVSTTLGQNCLVAGCGLSTTPLAVSATSSTDKTGWAAGLGAEYAIGANWSAKAEWLHIDLGTINSSLTTAGSTGPQTTVWSRTERYDQFRVGLNYRFGAL
jgi:outer membrane immunogenic protein